MRASEVAHLVDGTLQGGADPEVTGVAPLDRAGPNELSFLAHPRYLRYLSRARAGVILVGAKLAPEAAALAGEAAAPHIVVADVHQALAAILAELYPRQEPEAGIHPTAVVSEGVELGTGVSVGAYAVLGRGTQVGAGARIGAHVVVGAGCRIGPDAELHPHVTLYPGVEIGARTILHSGVRLGVDGFGYVWAAGAHRKIPQVGGCVVGDDVEIGANSTVDRGSVGATEIGNGVKIDNLVHLGHNVRVGEHTVIIAQVGVSGSTRVGKRVTLAGQVGTAGHIEIGDGATVAGQAGVFGDVPAGQVYSGYPARPHREALRAQASLFRLPELVKRLKAVERALFGREAPEE
jgi:UDP-3-O-[3-hydroxymyristoyl] glucosamine N-acyltransferase